jgi:hypothetical protein
MAPYNWQENVPPWRVNQMDRLWDVLPATTYQEIADKMLMRVEQVGGMLTYLRNHTTTFYWTVPHVRRGRVGNRYGLEENRFVKVLLQKGNGIIDTSDPARNRHIRAGANSSLQQVHTTLVNELGALQAYARELMLPSSLGKKFVKFSTNAQELAQEAFELIETLRRNGTNG